MMRNSDIREIRMLPVALLAAVALSTAACSELIFDDGPNNPPDTVFDDRSTHNPPTPQPGERVTTEPIVFHWVGTDVIDGDGIRAYYYRLTPGDTNWTRTVNNSTGFLGLRDTTYEFCVYSEDTRGLVDPVPTCRTFRVDIFRPGTIVFDEPFIDRDGNVTLYWRIVDSEIGLDSLKMEIWPVEFQRCDYVPGICREDPLPEQPATNWYRTHEYQYALGRADSNKIYCISVRAYDGASYADSTHHQVEAKRFCWPRRPSS